MEKYRLIREKNAMELTNRLAKVRKECAAIDQLLLAKEQLIREEKNPFRNEEAFSDYQQKLRAIDANVRAELINHGYDKDYLQPIFTCAACRDTGFVLNDDRQPQRCTCNGIEGLSAPAMQDISFEFFDEAQNVEYGKSQRQNMITIYNYCLDYCKAFPNNEKRNLLFYGGTGLGKSFLARSIVKQIEEKGFTTCLINSYKMMDAFKQKHIDGIPYPYSFYTCDFLVIDDLGTEPIYNNITVEYLFALINERMEAQKAMLIITNLTFDDCSKRYGERIASRIYDGKNTKRMVFFGNDLRN